MPFVNARFLTHRDVVKGINSNKLVYFNNPMPLGWGQ